VTAFITSVSLLFIIWFLFLCVHPISILIILFVLFLFLFFRGIWFLTGHPYCLFFFIRIVSGGCRAPLPQPHGIIVIWDETISRFGQDDSTDDYSRLFLRSPRVRSHGCLASDHLSIHWRSPFRPNRRRLLYRMFLHVDDQPRPTRRCGNGLLYCTRTGYDTRPYTTNLDVRFIVAALLHYTVIYCTFTPSPFHSCVYARGAASIITARVLQQKAGTTLRFFLPSNRRHGVPGPDARRDYRDLLPPPHSVSSGFKVFRVANNRTRIDLCMHASGLAGHNAR
jgi:hypothetical protein